MAVLTSVATPATTPSPTIDLPSGIPSGSTAYITLVVSGGALPTVTGFSGWTARETPSSHTSTGDVWLYSKTVGSGDSGDTVTGSLSATQKWHAIAVVVDGLEDKAPVFTQTSSLSSTPGVPAITPVTNDCTDVVVVGLIGGSGTGALAMTPPSGFTEDVEDSSASGGNEVAVYAAHKVLSGQAGVSQGSTTLGVSPTARAYAFRVTVKPAVTAEANAGPDQTVSAYATVLLDGTGSTQANLTTYTWTQTAGPTVTIETTIAGVATFTAPATVAGASLTFQLVTTDNVGHNSSPDSVTITVQPHTTFHLASGGPQPVRLLQLPAVTTPPPPPPPPPDPIVIPLSDFAQQSAGLYLASGTLNGSGNTYRLTAHTSTKVAPTSGTNQYKLIRAAGLNSGTAAAVAISNLTLEGTDQTPSLDSYGGLVVQYGSGSLVSDVTITGIPGYSSSPPGETFYLALFHSNSATLTRVTLDGYRTSDGAWVGATLLGYNYTTGTHVITDLVATNARYGFGLAMFQAAGVYTFTGADMRNNRKAINIEQSIGGTVYNFNSCDFRGTSGASYIAQVTSINSSSQVIFRDPVVDSYPVKVNCYSSAALNGANKQLDSDIKLFIGGVDKTADSSKLVITHL